MLEAVEGLRKDERALWFMDASLVITSEHQLYVSRVKVSRA